MPGDEFSWEDPYRTYVDTWRRIVFEPRDFFAVDRSGRGLQGPIGFLVVTLVLGGLGLALFGWGPTALPLLLIGGLLRVLIGALIVWLIAGQVFGGTGDYEATLRVLAYASAMAVFAFIPGVRVLAKLYALFLVVVGLERAHRYDAVRAVLTLLVTAICVAALAAAFGFGGWMDALHPAWTIRV